MLKKALYKLDNIIFKIEMFSAVVILLGLVFLVTMQVFNRFILKQPISWSEELARYLFTFLVFLGISAATKVKAHFGITFIRDQMNSSIQKFVEVIVFLSIVIFLSVVFVKSFTIINKSMLQTSSAMQIKIGYIYMILPVFSIGAIFHVTTNFIKDLTGGNQ